VRLPKKDDEPRRIGEMRLVLVGAKRRECFEPIGGCAVAVEFALLALRRLADPRFELGVGNRDERPWLLMRTAWCGAGSADRELDRFARDGLGGEVPCRTAAVHLGVEIACPLERLAQWVSDEVERNECRRINVCRRPHVLRVVSSLHVG
jgi:hypothetical protein